MTSVLRGRSPSGAARPGVRKDRPANRDRGRIRRPGAGSEWPWLVLLAAVVAAIVVGFGLFVTALAEPGGAGGAGGAGGSPAGAGSVRVVAAPVTGAR